LLYYSIFILTGTFSITGMAACVHLFIEKSDRPAGKFKLGNCPLSPDQGIGQEHKNYNFVVFQGFKDFQKGIKHLNKYPKDTFLLNPGDTSPF
jgi:hypothetical protein